jgi:glucose/mannose-6-phosphate isomerase
VIAEALRDRDSVTAFDPKGILALTDGFVEQCRAAEKVGWDGSLPELAVRPAKVVLTGLGGSAAGGDFVRAIFEASGSIPFLVNRDYGLPAYVGSGDLVFCASYSGNTEETLSAYEDAKRKGATVIVISSGGRLTELARAAGDPVLAVPGGQPPRTAMGWMMVPVLVACERLGLVPKQEYAEAWDGLAQARSRWTADVAFDDNPAKLAAAELFGKIPVIYGLGGAPAVVANRVRCQIHENAKAMAHSNGFPELNHNEILGWARGGKAEANQVGQWAGLLLSLGDESEKMNTRARITLDLIGDYCPFGLVTARGTGLLARMLWLAYFGDYVSVYLARLREVDPEDIGLIDRLKEELSKV